MNNTSSKWNDSIYILNDPTEPPVINFLDISDPFCDAGIPKYYLLPKYVLQCLSLFGIFLTIGITSFTFIFLFIIVLNACFNEPQTID